MNIIRKENICQRETFPSVVKMLTLKKGRKKVASIERMPRATSALAEASSSVALACLLVPVVYGFMHLRLLTRKSSIAGHNRRCPVVRGSEFIPILQSEANASG